MESGQTQVKEIQAIEAIAKAPTAESLPQSNHALDPDEDDLDDLDDLLDEFSNTQLESTEKSRDTGTPSSNEPDRKAGSSEAAADEFNKQLQEQMAALLGSADETPEMKKEIEAIMRDLGAAADSGPSASSRIISASKSTPSIDPSGGEDAFQETIRKTMNRMQSSGEQATAAAVAEDTDDIMTQMLKEMQSGGLAGAGGEEDFSNMLLSMMEQLTNKDILYEPMKELNDKFPAWMCKNKDSTKTEDLTRYEEQQRLVREIVEKFEEKGYSDSTAADREFIVERLQKMQAAGSPPNDLVGDLNEGADALGSLDAACPQQ